MGYRTFFGFQREPFSPEIRIEDLYPLPGMQAASERFHFALKLGAVCLVTGDVGSGKSTALRFAASRLHPSQYRVVSVVATTGSMTDILRQLCSGFDVEANSCSLAKLTRTLRAAILEISQRKQTPVLIIDEASLMRLEIFAQLHTLSQFDLDSQPRLPLILAGQNNLVDLLVYRTSVPLASRIVARCHLQGISRDGMEDYLNHHLKIAGISQPLFADAALTAIQQGSGGLLRRANHLARGALIAAAHEKTHLVSAEHVRIASTELV
jgi:type II secretory pathway predicted ATPase ExeA